jgi:hypothetical protein
MSVLLRSALVALSLLLLVPAYSVAGQTYNVDITDLSPDVAKALVEDLQKQKQIKVTPPVTASQAKEWAGVGKEIAAAISETAKGLSLEVNQFVNTPVGGWAMFFLIWTIIGVKIAKIFLGSVFVLIGTFTWWRSMRHFFWGDYQFSSVDSQVWCSIFHVAGAAFLLIVTCILIFGVL